MIGSGTAPIHQGQLVAHYRKALKWSQQDLADALGVSLRTVQRLEQTPMIEDIKRRDFLVKLLGIPAALMAVEYDNILSNKKYPLPLNDDLMTYLENALIMRFEAHQAGGMRSASRGLDIWMNEVTHFVAQTEGAGWHSRALAVLSMSYLLQGAVSRSMQLNFTVAHQTYCKAYQIAQELDDPELMALALFRDSVAFLTEDKPYEAITHLKGALDIINGHGFPHLKGHILKLLSEAYAKAQMPQEAWRSVGLAESTLSQLGDQPERSKYTQREFSFATVTAQRGVDAAFLKDYERAIKLIDKGLLDINPTLIPTRARLTVQKAEAYYGLGQIDFCIFHAEESLKLARSVGSNKTIDRIKGLHTTLILSRWNREPSVRRLGALLASS